MKKSEKQKNNQKKCFYNEHENTYVRRTNAKLKSMFNESDTREVLISRTVSWTGYVWSTEVQPIRGITIWKLDKKRPV